MSEPNETDLTIGPSRHPGQNWTQESDRIYHDWLYVQADRDRLNWYFNGYVSIQRFGELMAPYLKDCARVLEVGCGTAEMTCYMAQKFPAIKFVCVDHSVMAIDKAGKNSQRLGLTNMSFQACDFFKDPPPGPFDLILFHDSFHHFDDPRPVVKIVERLTDRVLLMEPHGNEADHWVRYMDFEFVNTDLHKIRVEADRIIRDEDPTQVVAADDPAPPEYSAHTQQGSSTEYRYPPEYYEKMLENFDLNVQGTVSGLDFYHDNPFEKTESHAFFNRVAAEVLEFMDNRLAKSGLDIFAKHWLIYGEKKGRPRSLDLTFDGFARYRTLFAWATKAQQEEDERDSLSFYAIEYGHVEAPTTLAVGSGMWVWFHIFNRGTGNWSSSHPNYPVFACYHWLSDQRQVVEFEHRRTPLTRPIGPNECAHIRLHVMAPPTPGRYVLQLDMVREYKAWFSSKEQPPAEVEILVTP